MKEKDASLTKLQTECDRIQQEADRASERRIWVKSLDDITASTDFEDFATITFETAKKLYGSDSDEAKAVGEARSKVGLSVYVREERSRTGKVGTGPRPSAKAGRNSNGEIPGGGQRVSWRSCAGADAKGTVARTARFSHIPRHGRRKRLDHSVSRVRCRLLCGTCSSATPRRGAATPAAARRRGSRSGRKVSSPHYVGGRQTCSVQVRR